MLRAVDIHCYDYVPRPFERVSQVLRSDPAGLFQRATNAAAERAETLVAKLKLSLAGLEVGKDVRIEVTRTDQTRKAPGEVGTPAMGLKLRWSAAPGAALFPAMDAELLVYPLSPDETQLDLHGSYTPPGGTLGLAADALVGRRIAQASIHRLLDDLAMRLRTEAS